MSEANGHTYRDKRLAEKDETIRILVGIIDSLRRPYMNTSRHDLYESATNALNELIEQGKIIE